MRLKNILKFQNKFSSKSGFTLIELLVVFFVSSVVATVVMTNFGDFTSETEFENEALNIALTIRQAQVYGISAKETTTGFNTEYGVVFNKSTPSSFTLNTFRDIDNNKFYTSDEVNVEETFLIKGDFEIIDLCIEASCIYTGTAFVFKRPDPSSHIYFRFLGNIFAGGAFTNGRIVLERISDGSIKTINVTDTGQIYVN